MKIEIWSDVMCPFCYIGKRRLENALQKFLHKDEIEIVWHSFQLDPDMISQPGKSIYEYLSERKGMSLERSEQLHKQLADTALLDGLEYNFGKAVIANSFNAHRLIQLAKQHNLGNEAEERLFHAYFTEGRNIADFETLVQLGFDIGLNTADVEKALKGDAFASEVKNDISEANLLGVQGVPFFVFDRKYAISGAQHSDVFLDVLEKAYSERKV